MDKRSKNKLLLITLIVIIIYIFERGHMNKFDINNTPKAPKKAYSYTVHGEEIQDDYAWLRDKGWPDVKDKEVLSYLNAENDYSNKYFNQYKGEADLLFNEMKNRIKLTDISVPVKRDDYSYYTRTEEDKNYPIYCRKFKEGSEEIILDHNKLAEGKKFLKIGTYAISENHRFLAYSTDDSGGERFKVYIKDLTDNNILEETIPEIMGSIIWLENQGFFYAKPNESWRLDKIYYHKLGTPSSEDKLIYHELDNTFRASVSRSSSRDFLFINVSSSNSDEIYYLPLKEDTDFQISLIEKRKEDHHYSVDHKGNHFYIHTNDTGKNFRLIKTKIENPAQENWEEIIQHNSEKYLRGFDLTQDYIILNFKEKGLPIIEVIKDEKQILKFPDEVYQAGAYSTNFKENDIRIEYSSLGRPDTTYSYNFEDNKLTVLKTKTIPSGFNPDDYEVKRVWAKSEEVLVPVSLIYKKSLFKGDNPLYLYGYGSYGYGMPVNFRSNIFSLIDRGVVFALAHIRGGDDLGYEWYESAKFLNKKRTFEDFINVAKHLIENKYTSKGNIVIAGGSAGGLLMGYAINKNPELFKAAVAHVPFVDVINTMLDESLPLTPGEFKEWGNPKDKEYYHYMKSYSPYDNIKAQNYPSLYITAGLNDQRVTYWEPAKWAAKLREHKTDKNLLLMEMQMEAGHSGASGRFDYLKEIVKEYIFVLNMFNKEIK